MKKKMEKKPLSFFGNDISTAIYCTFRYHRPVRGSRKIVEESIIQTARIHVSVRVMVTCLRQRKSMLSTGKESL